MGLAGNLKRKRDRAAYSRDYTFVLRDVLADINDAESAISELQSVPENERRSLSLYLISINRR